MSPVHRPILGAVLAAAAMAGLSAPALAQGVPYYYAGPGGPTVLDVDPVTERPVVPPTRPDLAAPPAIPVPHVMNGGGFGLTGFAYYNDGPGEGRLGHGHRVPQYVLAPAYKGPLGPAAPR